MTETKGNANKNWIVWIILGGGFALIFLLVIGLGVFLFFFNPPTERTIELKSSYSIVCPEGWKFSDQSAAELDDLTCEADDWNSSGIFMMYAFSDTMTPVEDMHQTYTEGFASNMILSNFSLTSGVWGEYGSFSGIRSTYTGHLLGLQHEGMVFTFQGCGKTFVVVTQAATEDSYKYTEDFETLEQGITCL